MTHNELLKMEYSEQYNQYRWIGQMQAAVLTFYGVVAVFAMAAVSAFRPQAPTPIDYRWPAVVMIVLGLLGLLIGYGLFRSRTMQRRTAYYLKALLFQMASAVEDSASLADSALRFRSLCSTSGRFKLWDTMNIAVLIALYSGELFVISGVLSLLVIADSLCLNDAIRIGVSFVVCLVVATPVLVQIFIVDKETERMKADCELAKNMKSLPAVQCH